MDDGGTDPAGPDSLGPGAPARVVETHTSVLVFVADRVYKLKKALDLGFLDHRDREVRRRVCQAEVDLNRRMAPDVYLGVWDVVDDEGRPRDHMVVMRRLPEERRLSTLLGTGEDLDPALRRIAHQVVALHEGSPASDGSGPHDHLGRLDVVLGRWTDGFDQLRTIDLEPVLRRRLDHAEVLVRRYLSGREALLDHRVAEGRIRDGHGDLQADDIFVLDDGPRIIDCIEFAEEYRWGDVLADVAFLAMDLERLGRPDLADRFLSLHRELSGDPWPATLAHLYVAYRAHVRAKVGIIRHHERGERMGAEVDQLVVLSEDHLVRAQVRLVVVGGLPGTGKSTLALDLGQRMGAVVLRSDEIRGQLDLGPDRYAPGAVAAVYDEMRAEARRLVSLGEHVVLDATWNDAHERTQVRTLARATGCALTELECTLPADVAAERIRHRAEVGSDASEATPAVAAAMGAHFAPWPEAVPLATDRPPEAVVEAALDALGPVARVLGPWSSTVSAAVD